MKILARHLTADLFNCQNKQLNDNEQILDMLKKILQELEMQLISCSSENLDNGHNVLMLIMSDGHITLHVYPERKYVALDVFLCREDAEPDKLGQAIRSFFKPDKIKTTILKRGGFGTAKELKPKVKTRVAPLRKIHNTGAKVIRILARRNNNAQ
ncbi:MAG: adenosylmethionine decarboxylase [Selenomonas sp.]|uniref:adenosylmethionine decarboxylase n=1 Tax=Selenomonas sp. TaxID=2053611 RepID=UPI0025D19E38|nr:adenosylmethionine decarboxylase [Selenomonas sp.]MCR5757611.1 adenosylmethionine decarboxylase [Selenomonas sp.]